MNTAIIKHVASAKNNAPAIYCESKSGNVYKLKQQVPLKRHARLISQIRSAKVINIQHWIKVKEGTFIAKPAKAKAPRPEYKEVVVKNQAARIKELQAEVKALKAKLEQETGFEAQASANEWAMELGAQFNEGKVTSQRSAAAKKGWATRRANAQQVAS